MRVLNFILQNQELVITLLGFVVAILRLTKWGKSNQDALIKVTEEIEALGDKELKQAIAARFETAPVGQQDVINHAVSVADPFKTPKSGYERLLLDLARCLMPKPKEGK